MCKMCYYLLKRWEMFEEYELVANEKLPISFVKKCKKEMYVLEFDVFL